MNKKLAKSKAHKKYEKEQQTHSREKESKIKTN